MYRLAHTFCLLLFLAFVALPATAQEPNQVGHWDVQAVGNGVARIRIGGGWNNSCIPREPVSVSRDGRNIRIHATAGAAPGGVCFAAGRGWSLELLVSGMQPGDYEVYATHSRPGVPEVVTPFGQHTFTYTPPPVGTAAQPVPISPFTLVLLALALLVPVARKWRTAIR